MTNEQLNQAARRVEFFSDGIVLRGYVRCPAGPGPHPLVVLGSGMGGIKEFHNIPDVVEALVGSGVAAMPFDYRNLGESDGEIREDLDHAGQIEDFRNAVAFASTLPEVDSQRIGVWGTSMGGRNVLAASALDPQIACVVAQVPLVHFPPELSAFLTTGGDVDQFYRNVAEDRRERSLGREPRFVPEQPAPGPGVNEYMATYREWRDRLSDDALQKWARPGFNHKALEPCMELDIRHLVPQIAPTPLLMIVARDDVLPGQLEAYESAGEPKSLLLLDGHHYSVYSTGNDEAVEAARSWFVEHLVLGAERVSG